MSITIRSAGTADAKAIVDLVTAAYRGESSRRGWTTEADLLDGQRTDVDEVGVALAEPDSEILVAEADGQIVGCINIDHGDGVTAHFGMFAVDPTRQSDGIGGRLLDAAEDLARGWGCEQLALEVLQQRAELQAWYRRRGYVPTGASKPFPYGDERFGVPRRDDLFFKVFSRPL